MDSRVSLGIVDMLRDYFYIEIYIKILIHRTREARAADDIQETKYRDFKTVPGMISGLEEDQTRCRFEMVILFLAIRRPVSDISVAVRCPRAFEMIQPNPGFTES